jgi:symplekin
LTQDHGLSSFDVKQLPPDLVVKIAVPLLAQVNPLMLTQAVEV